MHYTSLPEAPYERNGDVHDAVFPCRQTIDADGDTIHLYYGAADSCRAMATRGTKTNERSHDHSAKLDAANIVAAKNVPCLHFHPIQISRTAAIRRTSCYVCASTRSLQVLLAAILLVFHGSR